MDRNGAEPPLDTEYAIDFTKATHPDPVLINGEDITFDPLVSTVDDAPYSESTSFGRLLVDLRWDDLCYDVNISRGHCCGAIKQKNAPPPKRILKNVSGLVQAGKMLAIMGSSGAGKTTLLNLLAGRLTTSRNFKTSGRILLNGKKRNYAQFKKLSAYVEQDDNMFGELTVEEQIKFSALLRLPASLLVEEKEERVGAIIQELGLTKVRKSFIGNERVRGVSGGERKRVNVGTELVTDPSLIFLDEPTSGLDSFNALNVMYTLRKLASNHRTVITTIHQPRSNIFYLFDYLCLLAEGSVMYFGPASDAVTYFAGLHFRCPEQFNPADYFIDLLSIDTRHPEAEKKARARIEFVGAHHHTEKEARLEKEAIEGTQTLADAREEVEYEKYHASWFKEAILVGKRSIRLMTRERAANGARLGQTLIFSLLLGLIWLNAGRQDTWTQSEIMAINGVIFFIIINQSFGGVFAVIFVYPMERAIVMRERSSGTYRVSSYMLSKTVAELPRNIFLAIIFCIITYFMIGLRQSADAFFIFVVIIVLVGSIAEGLTLCISTIAPDPQAAAAITPIFVILNLLFGGFFIGANQIPAYFEWIRWLSFMFYAYQAAIQNQYKNFQGNTGITIELSLGAAIGGLVAIWVIFRTLWYIILRINGPKFDRSL